MATLKRGDILHKNSIRGRPPKPEKERKQKQRQAYQWRDARRVYLAGSFERWRKLRTRLQLKDSSLAWHLLETHDKGCDKCNQAGVAEHRTSGVESAAAMSAPASQEKNPEKFYPALVVAMRQLCHTHLHFEECVELMGLICVEIDHIHKDNFSLKEVVRSATRPKVRSHERDQTQLETSEAEAVAAVLDKSEKVNKDSTRMCLRPGKHVKDTHGIDLLSGAYVAAETKTCDERPKDIDRLETDITGSLNPFYSGSELTLSTKDQPSLGSSLLTNKPENDFDQVDAVRIKKVSNSKDSLWVSKTSTYPQGATVPDFYSGKGAHNKIAGYGSMHIRAEQESAYDSDFSEPKVIFAVEMPVCASAKESAFIELQSQKESVTQKSQLDPFSQDTLKTYSALNSLEVHPDSTHPSVIVCNQDTVSVMHVSGETETSNQIYRVDLTAHESGEEAGASDSQADSCSIGEEAEFTEDDELEDKGGTVLQSEKRQTSVLKAFKNRQPEGFVDMGPLPSSSVDDHGQFSSSLINPALSSGPESALLSSNLSTIKSSTQDSLSTSNSQSLSETMPTDDSQEVPRVCSSQMKSTHSGHAIQPIASRQSPESLVIPVDRAVHSDDSQITYRHRSTDIPAEPSPESASNTNSGSQELVVKSEPASIASPSVITSARTTHCVRRYVGDVPLDMSVVKEEADSDNDTDDQHQETFRRDSNTDRFQTGDHLCVPRSVSPTRYSLHLGRSLGHSMMSSLVSESNEMESSGTEDAGGSDAVSSMAILQQYTDRLLQSQLTSHLASPQTGTDDETPTKKPRLSETEGRLESEVSLLWSRKDMTQKAEYQFLETDPFMDFAEMSRHFPNMQQRTFYRWKRRIKDQFMFVEQRPGLTYAQFATCFPQVRENVFLHWHGLIARGHRFLAEPANGSSLGTVVSGSWAPEPSHSSGTHFEDAKVIDGSISTEDHAAQYIFLQKNLGLDLDQFTHVYPGVSRELFYAWKKQILIDFLKLQANPQISYQEFRKQASVTHDVFTFWKSQVTPHNPVTSSTPTTTSLPAPKVSTTCSPLPPVSLLAGSTSSKIGADLAAWYGSYAPLIGQLGLPFWPPLNLMSGQSHPHSANNMNVTGSVEDDITFERSIHPEKDKHVDRNEQAQKDDQGKESEKNAGGARHQSESIISDGVSGPRGRRQALKPEHYYYLQHPDISHAALSRLFPCVSVQRYGRWRRKVASALALLHREPHCTDEQFALHFPNIPEEILGSWRERVKQGGGLHSTGGQDVGADLHSQSSRTTTPTPVSPAPSGRHSRDSSLSTDAPVDETPNFLLEGVKASASEKAKIQSSGSGLSETSMSRPSLSLRKHFRPNREEFQFVQRFPNVDFATFTSIFPSISVRTYYRWRRQVRDGMDLLRTNPSIPFADFQKVVPEITEELFEMWCTMVREETIAGTSTSQPPVTSASTSDNKDLIVGFGDVPGDSTVHPCSPSSDTELSDVEVVELEGQHRPEQHVLHLNPYMDFEEFSCTYPNIPLRTFYRWKQEVRQVMEYMHDHSDVRYEDIASVLPDVSKEAFCKWRDLVTLKAHEDKHKLNHSTSDTAGTDDTLNTASQLSPTRSRTYSMRDTLLSLSQSIQETRPADVAFETRHQRVDVSEPRRISEQVAEILSFEEEEGGVGRGRRQVREEFIHVMLNPTMDYSQFAIQFGTVSQRTFYRWRRHIREWRAVIGNNPNISYESFVRTARDVPETVFNAWREMEVGSRSDQGHRDTIQQGMISASTAQHYNALDVSEVIGDTEKGSVGMESVSDVGAVNGGDEGHIVAYNHFLRNPTLAYEELALQFPLVSPSIFQQWKKSAEMKLEYIRSIRSTNFADFNSLFPDVPEDIFHIWKAIVLKEPQPHDNFLFLGRTDRQFTHTPVHNQSSLSSSTIRSNTSHFKHQDSDIGGDSASPRNSPSVSRSARSQKNTRSPRQGMSSDRRESSASKDEHSKYEPVVTVKSELPSTPLPSFTETVSNLSRLSAMLHHHISPRPVDQTATLLSPPAPPVRPYTASSPVVTQGLGGSFSTALADIVGCNLSGNGSSLNNPHFQDSHTYLVTNPQLSEEVLGTVSACGQDSNPDQILAGSTRTESNTDDAAHFLQRQRKIHRQEYMFLEQNPDVDVQEFLRLFPGVSLRTFYRWKREIREDHEGKKTPN